jgi:hypothetical protein
MYSIDNSQPSQVSQIISPSHSPSSPLSLLEYRDSPTADELDVPEFFQYSKEKYESAKSGCKRRRKSTRDEHCETSSMDGGDDVDDNVRQVSISKSLGTRNFMFVILFDFVNFTFPFFLL